jgi:hypothetical protein
MTDGPLDVDTELSEEVSAVRDFMYTNGPAVVDELILRDLPSNLLPGDEEVRTLIRAMLPEAIDIIFERYQSSDQRRVERSISPVRQDPTNRDSRYSTTNHDDHSLPIRMTTLPPIRRIIYLQTAPERSAKEW